MFYFTLFLKCLFVIFVSFGIYLCLNPGKSSEIWSFLLYIYCDYRIIVRDFFVSVVGFFVQYDDSIDLELSERESLVQETILEQFQKNEGISRQKLQKNRKMKKMLERELRRLKRLEKVLKEPSFENVLKKQNTELEKDQRIFSVRSERGHLSFIITSHLLLELFEDLCGGNDDYTPFFMDWKFNVGPFFALILAAKNFFLESEPSTPFIIKLSTHHTTNDVALMWRDMNEIRDITDVIVGVVDGEEGLYDGTMEFNDSGKHKSKKPSIVLIGCGNHRKRAKKRWLKDNRGLFPKSKEKLFLQDVNGPNSIYSGDEEHYRYTVVRRSKKWGNAIKRYFRRQWNRKFHMFLKSEKDKYGLKENVTNNLIEAINSMFAHLLKKNMSPLDAVLSSCIFISSFHNSFKRVCLGGGKTKFKEKYSFIREKYSSRFEIMYPVHAPSLHLTFESSEVQKQSQQLFDEVILVLFEESFVPYQLKRVIFSICVEAILIKLNKFFDPNFSRSSSSSFRSLVCTMYDFGEKKNAQVHMLSSESSSGEDRIHSHCSIDGYDSFCCHVLFSCDKLRLVKGIRSLFKGGSPYKMMRSKCKILSGKKPGYRTRKRVGQGSNFWRFFRN